MGTGNFSPGDDSYRSGSLPPSIAILFRKDPCSARVTGRSVTMNRLATTEPAGHDGTARATMTMMSADRADDADRAEEFSLW